MKRKSIFSLSKLLLFVWLTVLVTACGSETRPPTPTAEPTPTASATGEAAGNVAEEAAAAIVARTPDPTKTPTVIEQQISEVTEATGLAGRTFLGLSVDDWLNVVFSVLFFVVAYQLTVRLLHHLVRRFINRSNHSFYEALFTSVAPELRRLVALFFLRFAIFRLDFWSDNFRLALGDIFFIVGLLLLTRIALKLVNLSVEGYKQNLKPDKGETRLDPVILLLQHSSYIIIISLAVVIGLAHFAITSNIVSALLIITVVGLILMARDTISDVINGFIILVDQPFRVGDAIQLEDWPDWGWVTQIGSRSTRVKTWDNQLLIIPNSKINTGQVVNHSYPDPTYRLRTDIRLAYGSDLAHIRQVIQQTLQGVEEVLSDKAVEIYFRQFGDSTRLIRVHWWVSNCDKEFYMTDRVNTALEEALAQAGFDISFSTYRVDLNRDARTLPGGQENQA